MDQQLYDIVFFGQLVEGISAELAQTKLVKLFNSSPDNIARIFNGNTQTLKRAVSRDEALKYKAAFHQAGLMVTFKQHQQAPASKSSSIRAEITDQPQSTRQPSTRKLGSAENVPSGEQQADIGGWSIAPAGSDVLQQHERTKPDIRSIDTSAIKMVSVFSGPEVDTTKLPEAPDTHHLSIAAVGEDLLTEKHPAPPPLIVDFNGLTLAPAGSSLEELADKRTPLNPNTDYLSVAKAGVNLLEKTDTPIVAVSPETDHLSVAKD